ncbi:hypothetical protein GM708_12140 [Vibrio cholerae]|jgi:hypothetical protein|nr:hypothetical protein [Vibrio cholerae]
MTSIDGPLPDSSHLRQDINVPEEATTGGADASSATSTTSSLNAGQQVAGLSPVDEYRQGTKDGSEEDKGEATPEES